jgi:pimeloyl-ACP methyl ester carboxylesterase
VLIHLPGITGELSIDREFVRGIQQGGYQGEATIVDWTSGTLGIPALYAEKHNTAEAQKLADRLTQVRKDNPRGRIVLSAHSGGNGIAVWALERLPDGVRVDDVLLLAPALSPDYDLSKALRHVNGHVYAFTSPYDLFILGAGTLLFRTMDGKHADSAGRVGFVTPEGADAAQYGKLVQQPYQAEWMKYGNIGDHIGVMSRRFVATVIAPLVVRPEQFVPQPEPEPAGTKAAAE